MLLKIKIPRKNQSAVNLYLPLFILWLLLLPFFILLLPIYVLITFFAWISGTARFIIFIVPMFLSLLWHLQGLTIDVEDKDSSIYLSFI